ncbi:MAG: hypothetical protein NZL96_01330 [Patescibacteria group bacterium]|nr:hypothetical protein [Patescibacteria group bacterium]
MEGLSAVIAVKGWSKFSQQSLQSVCDLVKEIIILDLGLPANVEKDLKKKPKTKIVKVIKSIPYIELIREESKKYVKTEYVFFLDPDEIVPPTLKKIIKENYLKYDFIKIPRKNLIFGKWIKHSRWWPDYQIRVFKKNKVFWPKKLHQQPQTQGKSLTVKPQEKFALIHHNYQDLDQYFEKALRYAKSQAEEYKKTKTFPSFQKTVNDSIREFVSRYYVFKGYKDKERGFILAFLQLMYYFLVYFFYLEKKNFQVSESISPEKFFSQGLYHSLFWKENKTLKERFLLKVLRVAKPQD